MRIDRIIGAGILLVLVLGLFGIGYLVLGIQGIRLGDQHRTVLAAVNSGVSYLNRLQTEYPDTQVESAVADAELQRRYVAIQQALDDQLRAYSRIAVPEPPRLPFTPDDLQQAVAALGAVARQAGQVYQTVRNRIFYFSLGLSMTGFGIMLATLLLALRFRSYSRQFFRYIMDGGQRLQQVVTHEQLADWRKCPRWQEGEDYRQLVDNLIGVVQQERSLSETMPSISLEEFLPMLQGLIEPIVGFERIAFAFIDRSENVIAESAITTVDKVFLEPGFVQPLHETTLGELAASGRPRIIHDLTQHYQEIHQSRATELILQEGMQSSMTLPFMFNGTCIGFLFLSSSVRGQFSEEHMQAVNRILQIYKQSLYYQYLLQQVLAETSEAFVRLMEKKDNETSLHILRMARYSHLIAREYLRQHPGEQAPRFIREILWFAPLHDIGKIGVPDSILLKPGSLSDQEFATMREHVDLGVEVIEGMRRGINRVLDMNLLRTAIDLVAAHHEKFDGTGYPNRLKGEDIPLAGRIVAAADVFDALTSRRPYKDAWPVDQALQVMRSESGSHFCPKVIAALEAALPQILEVYERYKEV